jgi:lactoylglutathione lyase
MELLRARLRITSVEASLDFFRDKIGLVEIGRSAAEDGRSLLIFLAAPEEVERARDNDAPALELAWDADAQAEVTGVERGHVAYQVEDLYWLCHYLLHHGIAFRRPPRDGRMARVQSPDGHIVELRQQGEPREPAEPWIYMEDRDPEGTGWPQGGQHQSFGFPVSARVMP